MPSDGSSSLTSHHSTEHPHKRKRCRADSETSEALRRLPHQTSDASFAERNDLCGKRRRLLPSPSTSSSPQPENYRLLQSNLQNLSTRPQSAPESAIAEFGSAFDIEHPTHRPQRQKRKRSKAEPKAEEEPSTPQKRRQTARASSVFGPEGGGREEEDGEACTPISFWAHTGRWPENFSTMSQERSISPKKRPSSSSYTRSYKDGEVPKAHSAAHEKHFAERGLFMEELKGRSRVHKDSKSLCADLLRSIHPEPQYTTFPLEQFLVVWQRAQTRNEAKLYRDITPLLVPSPELLWICGHDKLEHVVDEISVEWTNCKTLAGPKPKPDFAVGIAPSAFSEEEMAKLQNYRSFERPTTFTDNMFFPFLLCEAKCTNEGIDRADRQNMHSSSIAVDAILQLYRAVDESKATELSGQILVFSVSHDNKRVNLYGHFAVVEGEKACFYRYPIASFVLNFEENQGRKRTHDFVREIYDKFYPAHLKRICDALAAMKDPRALSMTSLSVEDEEGGADSQEQDPSARSSQENTEFKVPGTPASKRQKGEVARLRQQLDQQRDQQREREAALLEQLAEQRKELEQQRKESKEERAKSEERQNELMKMLTEQSMQIKELFAKTVIFAKIRLIASFEIYDNKLSPRLLPRHPKTIRRVNTR